ncbi:hypothetical protein [Faecalibaculum rodentium]|uniref:hypothetical protein n=1 Tax=Faecalibaculum rodentium TaxID=1702221 RepID=UPI003F6683C5
MMFIKNQGDRIFQGQDSGKCLDENYFGSDRALDDTLRRLRKKLPNLNITYDLRVRYGWDERAERSLVHQDVPHAAGFQHDRDHAIFPVCLLRIFHLGFHRQDHHGPDVHHDGQRTRNPIATVLTRDTDTEDRELPECLPAGG